MFCQTVTDAANRIQVDIVRAVADDGEQTRRELRRNTGSNDVARSTGEADVVKEDHPRAWTGQHHCARCVSLTGVYSHAEGRDKDKVDKLVGLVSVVGAVESQLWAISVVFPLLPLELFQSTSHIFRPLARPI